MTDLRHEHENVMRDARDRANKLMRELFMSNEDTTLGAAIARSRQEGTEFASILGSQWSPIRWLRNRPGFAFEIGQPDFAGMGQDAFLSEIDEAVQYATMDAITANPHFLGELVRDIALGGLTTDIYEVEANRLSSWHDAWGV